LSKIACFIKEIELTPISLDRFVDKEITKEAYDKQLAEYEVKQTNVNTEMGKHHKADEEYYITVGMILSLAQRAYQIFKSSEVMEKRQLLNFLLRNCQLQGKKLLFELKTPFDTVLLANKCSNLLRVLDEIRTFFKENPDEDF